MEKIKIGINGFGRIGRRLLRLLHNHPFLEVHAINDIADPATLAHLFKYDSIHGIFQGEIKHHNATGKNEFLIDGKKIAVYSEKEIAKICRKSVKILETTSLSFNIIFIRSPSGDS